MKTRRHLSNRVETLIRKAGFFLMLLVFSAGAYAQNVDISGTVKDAAGEPLIGANVVEKGTTNGITTDLDGAFKLSLKEESIIQFSFIGYMPQEVKVTSQRVFNIF